MNKIELKEKLEGLKVNPNYYSLDGGNDSETLCLTFEGKWKTYYSERGNRTDETEYESESEACEAFLELIKPYSNTISNDDSDVIID